MAKQTLTDKHYKLLLRAQGKLALAKDDLDKCEQCGMPVTESRQRADDLEAFIVAAKSQFFPDRA